MATLAEVRQAHPEYGDMSDQQLADGLYKKFYSDMDRAAFDSKVGLEPANRFDLANPAKPAEDTPALHEAALQREERDQPITRQGTAGRINRAAQDGVANGLTLGFFNELASAAFTPIEMGIGAFSGEDAGKGIGQRLHDAYLRAYQKGQAEENAAYRANPTANIGGQVVGSVLTGGAAQKAGVSLLNGAKPTATSLITRGAGEGAAYGAISGAGQDADSLADRAKNAGWGAVTGAAVGGGVGAGAGLGVKAQALRNVSAPTTEELAKASSALYDQADMAGVMLSPKSVSRAAQLVDEAVKNEGLHPKIHPKAFAALDEIRAAGASGEPMTLQGVENLRRIAMEAAQSPEAGERRLAGKMVGAIDGYMDRLNPGDIVSAGRKDAPALLKEARQLWNTKSKSEIIDGLFYRAENAVGANYTDAGLATALRQQFKSIANNPSIMRRFNQEERKAILAVVRGAPLENMLRRIGKLAPTGVISSAISIGGGGAIGGPVGAVALPAVGFAARNAATRSVVNNANRAATITRGGGQAPQLLLPDARRRLLEIGSTGLSPAASGRR
jgi:hypothetical protein